jgi:hypothetical protein
MTEFSLGSAPIACRQGPNARAELEALYHELDAEVAKLGPACELSGRCCRFLEHGHTLFLSAGELEFLLDGAPPPARPLDRGDTCPWQNARGNCTARDARPIGCRVYYCDPSYQLAGAELSERFLGRLKQWTARHAFPWNYAPLHRHLAAEHAAGRLAIDLAWNESETKG